MSDLINRLRSGGEIHECNWSMLDEAAVTEYMKLNNELALLNKELASALVESRNNNRTAMSYLHEVQAIVLSKDFPEMVKKVAGYKALCDQLGNAINTLWLAAPSDVQCNNMHHPKPKQHRYDETCELVSEYLEAITGAQLAITAWRNSK